MSYYTDYLKEIEVRKNELGLAPKPIDGAELVSEIIEQIKDTANEHREDSLNFFIYNTLPGTTPAAVVKSAFLKDIVLGDEVVADGTIKEEESIRRAIKVLTRGQENKKE